MRARLDQVIDATVGDGLEQLLRARALHARSVQVADTAELARQLAAKDPNGAIYEWDYLHGHVERYDARGNHLGGYDAMSGTPVSKADSTRRVEP